MGRHSLYTPAELATWVRLFIQDNGYAPIAPEMAAAFGISKSCARRYMLLLQDYGYIRRGKGLRSIEVVSEERAA